MSVCSITGQKRREHVCKQQVGLSIWKAIRASVVCLEGQSWETDTSAREKTEKMLSLIFIFAHLQRHFSYSHLYCDPEIKQHTRRLCFHSWGSTLSCFCIFLKLSFITSFFPNIIFFIDYLGILYNASLSSHVNLPTQCSLLSKVYTKYNLCCSYTHWNVVMLPMARSLKITESFSIHPQEVNNCEKLYFSICIIIFKDYLLYVLVQIFEINLDQRMTN